MENPKKFHKSKSVVIFLVYLGALLALFYMFSRHFAVKDVVQIAAIEKTRSNYFAHLPIQAKAVYVFDTRENRVLFAKNEHIPLPIASITKIMTGLCALDSLEEDGSIVVGKSDITGEDKNLLIPDEEWKIRDLVSFMLVESSNDAARVLERAMGGAETAIPCMNKKAEAMNLFETKFFNATGLDIDDRAGAYGSAENAATMLQYGLTRHRNFFEKTSVKSYNTVSENGVMHIATNTNRVSGQIVGITASKTGFTDIAGGNLVLAVNLGLDHIVIVSILGSTEEGRFEDALNLTDAAIRTIGSQ